MLVIRICRMSSSGFTLEFDFRSIKVCTYGLQFQLQTWFQTCNTSKFRIGIRELSRFIHLLLKMQGWRSSAPPGVTRKAPLRREGSPDNSQAPRAPTPTPPKSSRFAKSLENSENFINYKECSQYVKCSIKFSNLLRQGL